MLLCEKHSKLSIKQDLNYRHNCWAKVNEGCSLRLLEKSIYVNADLWKSHYNGVYNF